MTNEGQDDGERRPDVALQQKSFSSPDTSGNKSVDNDNKCSLVYWRCGFLNLAAWSDLTRFEALPSSSDTGLSP